MSQLPVKEEAVVGIIIKYVSPILLTIIGTFIYKMIGEMQGDIKLLLLNQSANQIRIETLQDDVLQLKAFVYSQEYQEHRNKNKDKHKSEPQPAKKEDELNITK